MAQEMEKLPHKLTLDNRQKLTMQGVTQVMGFDDTQVLLATSQGNLLIQGENLQLKALSPEGINKDVTNIVLPLGATMHMDGSAMGAILKVAFLFGMFGQDFTTGRAILAIIVAVFSSVAMSGIPGGGGTGELALCTVFFPEQMAIAYPMALALGNLIDPPATMVNAAGDYVASFIVARFVDGKDWLQKQLHK